MRRFSSAWGFGADWVTVGCRGGRPVRSCGLRLLSVAFGCLALSLAGSVGAWAQANLVANPGFETAGGNGFAADWGQGEFGKVGKTLFHEAAGARTGGRCMRLVGVPKSFTTCAGKRFDVEPGKEYWVAWWVKGRQPMTSRAYLWLQTNLAQRPFWETPLRGDFDWTLRIVRCRTQPGETSMAPVLTMHTQMEETGESWWDDIGVWEKLPPDLEAIYRRDRPWDDTASITARRLPGGEGLALWCERPEARVFPGTPPPADAPAAREIALTAPGRGHDLAQVILTPARALEPLSLRFSAPAGPGPMPASTLTYRVVRTVPVKEVLNKLTPTGPTPDPLVEPKAPEPCRAGENALFLVEWAPPAGGKAGVYTARVEVLSGGRPVAQIPLRLRRWGFDLPEIPHFGSQVMMSHSYIRRFYPGLSEEAVYRLVWDTLSRYRLSGFGIELAPGMALKEGKLELDWARFDRLLALAKEYRASSLSIGPRFGGGCSEGWRPKPFLGMMPLADEQFAPLYVELNREIGARLRKAGLLERAFVYPYDEPEPDYFDKIAALCDLVHQGDPGLKCLMTVSPAISKPLWGKVNVWMMPWSSDLVPEVVEQRRAAGDDIWVYNMIASLEAPLLSHRLFLWQAFQLDAQGALLWNCSWWHQINPWENPTPAPYLVGRVGEERPYPYAAGAASLFYPDPEGKGPLVPNARLVAIRQGVEDFDLLTELLGTWRNALPRLSAKARQADPIAKARFAFSAPVILERGKSFTSSIARAEALRLMAGNMLEAAGRGPAVIAYPAREEGKLVVTGWAEPGTRLSMNGKPVKSDADGRFLVPITDETLAAGMRWTATRGKETKGWEWPGLE